MKQKITKTSKLKIVLGAFLFVQIFAFFASPSTVLAYTWEERKLGVIIGENETNCPVNKLSYDYTLQLSKKLIANRFIEIGMQDQVKANIWFNIIQGPSTAAAYTKVLENCKRIADAGQLKITLQIDGGTIGVIPPRIDVPLYSQTVPVVALEENEYGARFDINSNLKPEAQEWANGSWFDVDMWAQLSWSGENPATMFNWDDSVRFKSGNTGNDEEIRNIQSTGGTDSTVVRKLADVKVVTKPGTDGKGLRSKYRVLYNEPNAAYKQIKFGSNGVDPITMDWASPANSLVAKQQRFEIPQKDKSTLGYDYDPLYWETFTGLNFKDQAKTGQQVCKVGWVAGTDCTNVIFPTGSANGSESGKFAVLPAPMNPTLSQAAWQNKKPANVSADGTTSNNGKPLYTVSFSAIPVIQGYRSASEIAGGVLVALSSGAPSFDVEVFNTEADIKAACEGDSSVTDKSICNDPQKMRYAVGGTVTQTSGTDETTGKTAGQSLLDFLRNIITMMVLIQNSIVYYIFSYIVAPFLVAILKIQAYKDDFVSVIYPGWLILRNLSNIIFIVALLAIGLGTMFQLKGYQARSMIIKLILMALLLNFSLVFAQSIVALADTVQAQFLPADSNVVNALANQLMVRPLELIRAQEGGSFSATTQFSEIGRAVVLSFFAICALFAFIVVAAFLVVRLLALWILYLTSPIAYVGAILPFSQGWAGKWWKEFLKYAFVGPVLAFFLNMAALFATGNFFQSSDFGDEGFAAGAVNLVLLAAQNLFIIGFMIFGLKSAASSGIYGAKAITDFAEKGVKWPYKAAGGIKDWVGDKAAETMKNRFGDRAGNITQALFNPIAAGKAIKSGAWDKPGAERKKRVAERLGNFEAGAGTIAKNPWKAAMQPWYKLTGKDSAKLNEKAELRDNVLKNIKNDKEREKLDDQLQRLKQDKNWEKNDGRISAEQAKHISDKMNSHIKDLGDKNTKLDEEINKLTDEEKDLRAKGNNSQADAKLKAIKAKQDERKKNSDTKDVLESQKKIIDNRIAAGAKDVNIGNLVKGPNGQYLKDTAVKEVESEVAKEINDIEKKIQNDEKNRKEFGVPFGIKPYAEKNDPNYKAYTDTMEKQFKEERDELWTQAINHKLPQSQYARDLRLKRKSEAAKAIEEIDDKDALIARYNAAYVKKNGAEMEAIIEKIAKQGDIGDLLERYDKKKNGEDMKEMLVKHFVKDVGYSPDTVRQVAASVSKHNASNNLLNVANMVKVKADGSTDWTSAPERIKAREKGINKKAPGEIAKMKIDTIAEQNDKGEYKIDPTALEYFNNLTPKQRAKIANMSKANAEKFMSAENFGKFDRDIQDHFAAAAGKKKNFDFAREVPEDVTT